MINRYNNIIFHVCTNMVVIIPEDGMYKLICLDIGALNVTILFERNCVIIRKLNLR